MFAYASDKSVKVVLRFFHRNGLATTPPDPHALIRKTTPPQVLPCTAPLMNIDPFMFFPLHTANKEDVEKYAKLSSPRSHTCTSSSLGTKLFSPLTRR